MSLGGRHAETHRNMAMHVTLQSTGQVKHLGFETLQDLCTENGKSENVAESREEAGEFGCLTGLLG